MRFDVHVLGSNFEEASVSSKAEEECAVDDSAFGARWASVQIVNEEVLASGTPDALWSATGSNPSGVRTPFEGSAGR